MVAGRSIIRSVQESERVEWMKKLLMIVLLGFILLLTACSQAQEDTKEFSGMISDGNAFGYKYTVIKEQNDISWVVGYKGDTSIIQENQENRANLDHFMKAVGDTHSEYITLLISLSYVFIIVIGALFLFKRNRKTFNASLPFMAVFAGIALYIAIGALEDMNSSLQDIENYYSIIKK